MGFVRKRVAYMVITEDEEFAKELRRLLDEWTGVWWKWYVKYYNDKDEEPYYQTSESSGANYFKKS